MSGKKQNQREVSGIGEILLSKALPNLP